VKDLIDESSLDLLKVMCQKWDTDKFMFWARTWNGKKLNAVIGEWPPEKISKVLQHRFLSPSILNTFIMSWETVFLTAVLIHCDEMFVHAAINVVYYEEERWSDEDVGNLLEQMPKRIVTRLISRYDSEEAAFFMQHWSSERVSAVLKLLKKKEWVVALRSKIAEIRFDAQWQGIFGNADLTLSGLRKIFDKVDLDNSGTLSMDEISKTIETLSGNETVVSDMMRPFLVDAEDGSSVVTFEGFVKIVRLVQERTFRRKAFRKWMHVLHDVDCHNLDVSTLREIFDEIDTDRSGSLSQSEIRRLLGAEEMPSNDLVSHMLSQADTDGDGEISFQEFCDMIRSFTKKIGS